jgi:hypothetical protein
MIEGNAKAEGLRDEQVIFSSNINIISMTVEVYHTNQYFRLETNEASIHH